MREDAAKAAERAIYAGKHGRDIPDAIRALPLPEAPPALAEALRQHEEAVRIVGQWEQANVARPFGTAPDADPRPRAAETRAALLDAMAGLDLDLGPLRAALGDLDAAYATSPDAMVARAAIHIVIRAARALVAGAPPDVETLTREAVEALDGMNLRAAARLLCEEGATPASILAASRWLDLGQEHADERRAFLALARLLLALPEGAP